MAQVTVEFEDYQSGSLPDVCVLTGVTTTDRMVLRTSVRDQVTGSKPAGRLLGSFDSAFDTLDPRKPRHVLVGRLPIERAALRKRLLERRTWQAVRWGALTLLVVSAWVSAPWSPVAAVASIAALVVAAFQGWELQQGVPRPTLIRAGSTVHLQNVHESFAAAVEEARAGGGRIPAGG